MGAIASQITNLTIVYSTVYSNADQRKHKKLRVTGLCAGNSPGTGEFSAQMASYSEKCFHLMTSSLLENRVPGPRLNYKDRLSWYEILMLKIRRSRDRPIFNMGIAILVRRLFILRRPQIYTKIKEVSPVRRPFGVVLNRLQTSCFLVFHKPPRTQFSQIAIVVKAWMGKNNIISYRLYQ